MTLASGSNLTRTDTANLLKAGRELDRSSPVPLWRQLRDRLAASIQADELPPHAPLPSEINLCALFAVSRPVVRAALDALTADAMVVKATRRGAFVAHRKDELDFAASNVGLFGEMTAKGHHVTTRLIKLARRQPSERETAMLRLTPGAEIVHLERVYLIDGQPMAVGVNTLPANKVPGLESADLADRSLYMTLRDQYGLTVARSERWLDAVMPTPQQCGLLEMAAPTPVIAIESVGWLADTTPVEYYNAIYSTRERRLHLVVGSSAGGRL